MARNAVHSALFCLFKPFCRDLFVLGVRSLSPGQILVYVGGVMVLFLFVIMLVNVGAEERGNQPTMNKPRQVTISMIFCLLLVLGLLFAINVGYRGLQKRNPTPVAQNENFVPGATGTSSITTDTQRVGNSLYRFAALPLK